MNDFSAGAKSLIEFKVVVLRKTQSAVMKQVIAERIVEQSNKVEELIKVTDKAPRTVTTNVPKSGVTVERMITILYTRIFNNIEL